MTLLLCVRVCVFTCARVLLLHDRKGRSDGAADCQNWQDVKSDGGPNAIEAIAASAEAVDGRQKVRDLNA